MNKHCGKSKSVLMDEAFLKKAIAEQLPQDHIGHVPKTEGIHFKEITKLHLEYRGEKNEKKMTNQYVKVWVQICERLFVRRNPED